MEAVREPIGWVIDNSAHDSFSFVVMEGKHVEFGNYYIVKHPSKGVDVLTRVVRINYKNPEMDLRRYGVMDPDMRRRALDCQLLIRRLWLPRQNRLGIMMEKSLGL